jgi:hypothetical protein
MNKRKKKYMVTTKVSESPKATAWWFQPLNGRGRFLALDEEDLLRLGFTYVGELVAVEGKKVKSVRSWSKRGRGPVIETEEGIKAPPHEATKEPRPRLSEIVKKLLESAKKDIAELRESSPEEVARLIFMAYELLDERWNEIAAIVGPSKFEGMADLFDYSFSLGVAMAWLLLMESELKFLNDPKFNERFKSFYV